MLRNAISEKKVKLWLDEFSLTRVDSHGDRLVVMATPIEISNLFQVEIRKFQEIENPKNAKLRVFGDIFIPIALKGHIELIAGLTELFKAEIFSDQKSVSETFDLQDWLDNNSAANAPPPAFPNMTPEVLRTYYNVSSTLAASGRYNVQQAVSAFGQTFSAKALSVFGAKVANSSYPFTVAGTPGGVPNPMLGEGEGDLDIQYSMAMGQNVPTYFWSVHESFWILEYAIDVAQTPQADRPKVHSLSYGTSVLHQCDIATAYCHVLGYNSFQYVQRTDIELQKLGVLGVTVLVSSGDNGAPGRGNNGHIPLDTSRYCPIGGCQETTTSCGGVELSLTKGSINVECILPLGVQGYGCSALAAMLNIPPQNFTRIFDIAIGVIQKQIGITGAYWDLDARKMPHLFIPRGHSCSSFSWHKQTQEGLLTVGGYVFDPNEEHVGDSFISEYPGSSPYILSVGATNIHDVNKPEVVASIDSFGGIITSGGGFAAFHTRPAWQDAVVNDFLRTVKRSELPPQAMYNASNRAIPDVTFCGERYVVVALDHQTGKLVGQLVSGTSASSPALAGLISLVNEKRLEFRQPALGFVNKLMYQAYADQPNIFRDIVSGDVDCTNNVCAQYGWSAQPGYDLASGLGSIDFGRFLGYALGI